MRVLLLNPPCRDGRRYVREGRCTHATSLWGTAWPPYTLALLGGRLRQRGHTVRLLDGATGAVRFRELGRRAADFDPDLALLAVSAPTFPSDLQCIAEIRAVIPRCSIGVFGVHPTAAPELYLAGQPHADFVIRGEPELTADRVVEMLDSEGRLQAAEGLSTRCGSHIEHGPSRPPASNLSALGKPDWSLIQPTHYRLPFLGRPFLPVLTSRGCLYVCTFCTQHLYYGRRFRTRAAEEVAAEVEELRAHFGVRDFFLWSECFSADQEHAHAVCEALKKVRGISWVATTRADCVSPDLLRSMRQSGCWLISFGFECGSEEVLEACRKGHTLEASVRAARWAREAGLMVVGQFIFGLPGETPETARQTLRLALALKLDFAQFYCAAPYPGTELHEAWCSSWSKPGAPLLPISQEQAWAFTGGLSARATERWRSWATLRFYGRPHSMALLFKLALSRISGRQPCE